MEFVELIVVIALLLVLILVGYLIGKYVVQKQMKEKIHEIREDAIKQSRSVLAGQFSEQLAPYLPDFPYKPTEARFIGKPIDFVVFKGMDEKNIGEVVFVEVKSGQSKLNGVQRALKSAIENRNVSWYEYKVPEELTKEKES